jgi:hypothetical protein
MESSKAGVGGAYYNSGGIANVFVKRLLANLDAVNDQQPRASGG